jgi:hypothetical protein
LGANTAAERVAATAISDLDAGEQHTLRSLLERVCLPASEPLRDRLNRAPA